MTTLGQALAQACAQTGLDDRGARILYARSNTVYKLATAPVVVRLRYAPGSQEWSSRLSVSVHRRGRPLVIAVSAPGAKQCVVQAIGAARQRGVLTVAITGAPGPVPP